MQSTANLSHHIIQRVSILGSAAMQMPTHEQDLVALQNVQSKIGSRQIKIRELRNCEVTDSYYSGPPASLRHLQVPEYQFFGINV
ncbi:hypothetical protein ACC703_05735 [Rhizobium ruizarguesonis]